MKTLSTFFVTAMCGMLTLSSCSTEEVFNNTVAELAEGPVKRAKENNPGIIW